MLEMEDLDLPLLRKMELLAGRKQQLMESVLVSTATLTWMENKSQ